MRQEERREDDRVDLRRGGEPEHRERKPVAAGAERSEGRSSERGRPEVVAREEDRPERKGRDGGERQRPEEPHAVGSERAERGRHRHDRTRAAEEHQQIEASAVAVLRGRAERR